MEEIENTMELDLLLQDYYEVLIAAGAIDVYGDSNYHRYPEDFSDVDMVYEIEELVASPQGQRELLSLFEDDQVKLWKFALEHRRFTRFPAFRHHNFPRISTPDTNEETEIGHSIIIINRMLNVLPNSLMLPDDDNSRNEQPMIIHILGPYYDLPQALVFCMIDMNPNGVLTRGQEAYDGNVLLHMVFGVWANVPYNTIQAVYRSHPSAAKYKNYKGETPLHVAAQAPVNDEFITFEEVSSNIEFLVRMYPDAAGIIDNKGFLPITHILLDDCGIFHHLTGEICCSANELLRALKILQEAYPNFVHLPMIQKPSLEENSLPQPPLLYLIRKYPYSCQWFYLFLIDASPQDIFNKDEDGYTPLEYFVGQYGSSLLLLLECIKKCLASTNFQSMNDMARTFQNIRDITTGDNILHVFSKVKTTYPKEESMSPSDPSNTRQLVVEKLVAINPSFTMDLNHMGYSAFHVRLMQQHGNEFLLQEVQVMANAMAKKAKERNVPDPAVTMHDGLKMYPFMMAASKHNPCLSTTYYLLQKVIATRSLKNL